MFIEEYPGIVPVALCERIITLFEEDPRREPSVVITAGQKQVSGIRSGMTIQAPTRNAPEWADVMQALQPAFGESISLYAKKYASLGHLARSESLALTPPNIERVDPGQGFDWHADQGSATRERVVAGLLYLRTVTDGGGFTEFGYQQRKVQPEAGKIVLFPPFWTHQHRGASPVSQAKYVISFFWCYPPAR